MREPQLSDWLALREPVDHESRSASLTRALADALPQARPLRILDLGTGTGSNIRFLQSRLPSPQAWRAMDQDPALLERLPSGVAMSCVELSPLEASWFEGAHLVTASALLDLVSVEWIARLARRCLETRAAALFALNYNGSSTCTPEDADDAFVLEQFNRHQRASNKGFGRAAGPGAASAVATCFAECGYEVRGEPSDWHLTPEMVSLQTPLIEGWAYAASEIAPSDAGRIQQWLGRRLMHVREGRSRITVGHTDLAAWLVK